MKEERAQRGRTAARAAAAERLSPFPILTNGLVIVALLVVLNGFPEWFGVPVWSGRPDPQRTFVPLLASSYRPYLPLLNLWLGLNLTLKLWLLRQRRWDPVTRWIDPGVDVVGALVCLRLMIGPAFFGLNPQWLDRHAVPAEMRELLEGLAPVVGMGLRLALAGGFLGLALTAGGKLFRRFPAWPRARDWVREVLAGRTVPELMDLFTRDASRAYAVLDREGAFGPEPERGLRRFLHRVRVLFRGVSRQLSPARRLLFAACVVGTLAGVLLEQKAWSLAAAAGLLFLLALELVDRIRVRDELQVAQQLQRDLLPASAPDLPGYELVHSYRTAYEVGGDYYDFLTTTDGRLALMVGDASGHGMAAGLLMAIASATLKAAVDLDPAPDRVVAQLNRALCRSGDRRAFMTLFYGVLNPADGSLEYVCAGHPFPMLRRAGGAVAELGAGALPAGMREAETWAPASILIEPGDRLVLFSDGLPEAVDRPDGEAFGFGRIRELLGSGGSARQIHDRILRAFDNHLTAGPIADDLTLVVLGRL